MRLVSNRVLLVPGLPGYWQCRFLCVVTTVTGEKVRWVTPHLVPLQSDNRCYRCNQDNALRLKHTAAEESDLSETMGRSHEMRDGCGGWKLY